MSVGRRRFQTWEGREAESLFFPVQFCAWGVLGRAWGCACACARARACGGFFLHMGRAWVCLGVLGRLNFVCGAYLGVHECAWACLCVLGSVWACLGVLCQTTIPRFGQKRACVCVCVFVRVRESA